jgi:erythromycin esterase
MAQNVAQILEQNGPQSKIVLWAHNAHIANAEGRLGSYLKQQFDEQVYLLGFEFNQGEFTSRMATVHTYGVKPVPPTHYAYALAKANHPILFLDFRTMACIPELRAWLAADQSSHELQELYAVYRLFPAWHTLRTSWLGLYDGVIFIDKSTPTSGLP